MKRHLLCAALALLCAAPAWAVNRNEMVREVTLFFGANGGLKAELARIPQEEFVEFEIRSVIDQLVRGSENFTRTVPETVKIQRVFLDTRNTVYLDFNAELVKDHPGGVAAEILTVASICRSVFTNFNVNEIRILVDGAELKTLAGHLDLDRPISRADVQEWLAAGRK